MNLKRKSWWSRIAILTAGFLSLTLTVNAQQGGGQIPGDCNQDGNRDISDPICYFQFLFLGAPNELPCGADVDAPGNVSLLDWNGDQLVDISDGISMLLYLFVGGNDHVLGKDCVRIVGCPQICEPQDTDIFNLVHIQPFRLEQSFKYDWRRDQPDVQSGLLVVLKVNSGLVTPRNTLEPVLYAENQTVQRLNHGHESGFVVGIIPEQIDLSDEPIWFGSPALPERIDEKTIADERTKAEDSGEFFSLSSDEIKIRTQPSIIENNLTTLLRNHASGLLLKYSPQEERLAKTWRLPETTP